MKNSYYIYAILAIIIIILAVVLFQNRPSAEEQAMQACIDAAGTYDASTQACVPAGTPVTTVTTITTTAGSKTAPVSATKQPASSGIGTVFTPPAGTIALPVYYDMASTTDTIRVSSPSQGNGLSSPLQVTGLALGQWFSANEGSFPVILTNAAGRIIARGTVSAQSNWKISTGSFVPFSGTLTFAFQQSDTTGTFYLLNGNASDVPPAAMMPVIFK